MNAIETFFNLKSETAKKHKLNTCNKPVPQECLDAIEAGCSLEQLEQMLSKFDIYKYGTQITIHGLFPTLSTRRVGGYVNLSQNKNKSIGVRYTAIDYDKKRRLFDMLRKTSDWNIERNSTNFAIYKQERLPSDWRNERDRIVEIVNRYRQEADRIDKTLFVGNVSCYVAEGIGCSYVVLFVNIRCFYDKNFKAIFENLSGMTYSDGSAKYESIVAENKRAEAKREDEYKAMQIQAENKRAEMKATLTERNAKFVEENRLDGFEFREKHVPQNGDIVARIYQDYDYKLSWRIFRMKKCFGRMNATPCDENGNKSPFSRGGFEAPSSYDNVYVKRI